MAAMRIQRAQRLHAAKNELRTARDRRDAAQALQKVWRGRVGRRVAKRRKYEKRVQERVKLEIEAAIKLQKVQRGRVGRRRAAVLREKRDRELAAVILQAAWRGREGRKLAESMRRESAAAQVQKHFRAYRARTDFKRHKAARIIQVR